MGQWRCLASMLLRWKASPLNLRRINTLNASALSRRRCPRAIHTRAQPSHNPARTTQIVSHPRPRRALSHKTLVALQTLHQAGNRCILSLRSASPRSASNQPLRVRFRARCRPRPSTAASLPQGPHLLRHLPRQLQAHSPRLQARGQEGPPVPPPQWYFHTLPHIPP